MLGGPVILHCCCSCPIDRRRAAAALHHRARSLAPSTRPSRWLRRTLLLQRPAQAPRARVIVLRQEKEDGTTAPRRRRRKKKARTLSKTRSHTHAFRLAATVRASQNHHSRSIP